MATVPMKDQRGIPREVRRRLQRAGLWTPTRRTRGVDRTIGDRIVEERRTAHGLALRSYAGMGDSTDTRIVGYAYTHDEYDMYGGPPWGWTESIAPGASTKTLAETRNIVLNYNHGGLPLATTAAGTLTLAEDDRGLAVDASPDMTSPYTREVVSRIDRGELDRMSFAFRVVGHEWQDDYTRRIIREVELFDVSVVDIPANDTTDVGLAGDDLDGLGDPVPLDGAIEGDLSSDDDERAAALRELRSWELWATAAEIPYAPLVHGRP